MGHDPHGVGPALERRGVPDPRAEGSHPISTVTPTRPGPLRWVERLGRLAIIIRTVGEAWLVRYATGHGGYHWVGRADLVRRPDLDDVRPDPPWLAQARRSARPPQELFALLHGEDPLADDATRTGHDFEFETDADGRPRETPHD